MAGDRLDIPVDIAMSTPGLLARAVDALSLGVVVLDPEARVVVWNRWMVMHTGIEAQRTLGHTLSEVFGAPLDNRVACALSEALKGGRAGLLSHALNPCPLPLYSPSVDGCAQRIKQSISVLPLGTGNGQRGCMLQISDMTPTARREQLLRAQSMALREEVGKLTQTEAELRRSEQRFRTLAEQAPVGIFETDQDGSCIYTNQRWCGLTGLSPEEAFGSSWLRAVHEDDQGWVEARWQASIAEHRAFCEEFRVSLLGGSATAWVLLEASPVRGDDGDVLGYIGTLSDISIRKQQALRNEFLAYHDTLTSLPNRARFQHELELALEGARILGHQLALMFIDLDGFKSINDSLGHDIGDVVLKTVAERLSHAVRRGDLLARYGGDEFVLLVGDYDDLSTLRVMASRFLDALAEPVDLGMVSASVRASIGVACFPDDAQTPEALLRLSDEAMYLAKQQAGSVVFITESPLHA